MNSLPLYVGHEHECAYLPGRTARMAMVPPDFPLNRELFSILVANGFRRSGELVYRTYCQDCAACVPVRVPVERFRPNRSQRRVQRLNAGLQVVEKPPSLMPITMRFTGLISGGVIREATWGKPRQRIT